MKSQMLFTNQLPLNLIHVIFRTVVLAPICCLALCLGPMATSANAIQTQTQNQPATKQATNSNTAAKTEQEKEVWQTFTPTDAGASFQMPIKPRYVERVFSPIKDKPPIKVYLRQAVVNEGKHSFMFSYHDLHETPKDDKTRANALRGAIRGCVVNVNGQLNGQPKNVLYKTNYGRQFNYSFSQGENQFIVVCRLFLVGKRLYQITFMSVDTEYSEQLTNRYLNSFRLIEPENEDPPTPRIQKQATSSNGQNR